MTHRWVISYTMWRSLAAPASALRVVDDPEDRGGAATPGAIIQGTRYRELQTRPAINGWTPDLVNMAAASADLGNMLFLADLVEAMLADDRISGVLQTLTLGMLGLPLSFRGGSPELREWLQGGDERVGGEWDCMHPEAELQKFQAWAVMLGFAVAQRVPLPRLAGQRQRYRMQTWHPRWVYYDHVGASGSHWRIQTMQGIQRVIPGAQWMIWMPFGEQRPWSEGKWRRCAFPWLAKHFAIEDRANQGETVGSPTWKGTSPQGGTERQRQTFLAQLTALGRNGRIVLPPGWDLDLVESTGQTWEIFSEQSNWADQAMTIVIASQTSTTEGSPGFDSGKTQDQILQSVTRFYAKSYSRCLYEQIAACRGRRSTRATKRDAPCGYWNTERANAQASQATTFQTIGQAGTLLDTWLDRRNKLAVDDGELCDRFGIPTKSNEGMKPPAAPQKTPEQAPKPPKPKLPSDGGGANDSECSHDSAH